MQGCGLTYSLLCLAREMCGQATALEGCPCNHLLLLRHAPCTAVCCTTNCARAALCLGLFLCPAAAVASCLVCL